ncbi:MAG: hypothetical protein WEB00_09450 [Dehalococcoidia bacterium]
MSLAALAALARPPTGESAKDAPQPVGQSPGAAFASAVTTEPGKAMAWGKNNEGQVGSTVCEPCFVPFVVNAGAGLTDTVISVDAGGNGGFGPGLSTGHSLAVLSNGTVWAWGSDRQGQIGDGGSNTERLLPVQVIGVADAVSVAAGGEHSLALLENGTVVAWGDDAFGQLGSGETIVDRDAPVPVTA